MHHNMKISSFSVLLNIKKYKNSVCKLRVRGMGGLKLKMGSSEDRSVNGASELLNLYAHSRLNAHSRSQSRIKEEG